MARISRHITFGESDKFAEILKEAVEQPDINAKRWVKKCYLNISEDLINRLKELSGCDSSFFIFNIRFLDLEKYQDKCTAGTNLELVIEYLLDEMYQFLDFIRTAPITNFKLFYSLELEFFDKTLKNVNELALPSPTRASAELLKVQQMLKEIIERFSQVEKIVEPDPVLETQKRGISRAPLYSIQQPKAKDSLTIDKLEKGEIVPTNAERQSTIRKGSNITAAHSENKEFFPINDINKPYKERTYKIISICAIIGSGVAVLLGILMQSRVIEIGKQPPTKLGPILLSGAICWFIAAGLGALAISFGVKNQLEQAKAQEAGARREDSFQEI